MTISRRALEWAIHAVSLDGAKPYEPGARREGPPHESHSWRGAECGECGARIEWQAAAERCPVRDVAKTRITFVAFLRRHAQRLVAFHRWWSRRHHDLELPSDQEWLAEFLEWSKRYRGR